MNMFKTTPAKNPKEYIALLEEPRRSEIQALHTLIQKAVPGLKPHIMSGMVAYGSYHYKYASGREGDWSLIMLASQKNYISLYICAAKDGEYLAEVHKSDFPKASIGKSCMRFKKIDDIDLNAVTRICKRAEKFGGYGAVSA